MANGVTVTTGNNTSPPNNTKFQTKDGGSVGHVPAVVLGYSDGSDNFVTANASGVAVQGTTTITGVSNTTATVTSVADNAASTQLLAANSSRIGWTITNTSSAVLYIKFGSGATTTTSYTKRLVQYADAGQGPLDGLYTGAIYGIWATDPGDGAANCTEW